MNAVLGPESTSWYKRSGRLGDLSLGRQAPVFGAETGASLSEILTARGMGILGIESITVQCEHLHFWLSSSVAITNSSCNTNIKKERKKKHHYLGQGAQSKVIKLSNWIFNEGGLTVKMNELQYCSLRGRGPFFTTQPSWDGYPAASSTALAQASKKPQYRQTDRDRQTG